jgi:hypothetical protein
VGGAIGLNLLRPMIHKSRFERKKTVASKAGQKDGRRWKKGIDIHYGGRKRKGAT